MSKVQEFFEYLSKREDIRVKKEELLLPYPWTDDFILQNFKFTNVKRENDRTTRFFANFYRDHASAPEAEALYNAGLYRYFGTSRWAESVGWMTTHDEAYLLRRYDEITSVGLSAFTGAYVITNGGRAESKETVVLDYLYGLWKAAPRVVGAIEKTRTWEAGYKELKIQSGFGGSGFMAKEVLQDYLIWMKHRNNLLNSLPEEDYITDYQIWMKYQNNLLNRLPVEDYITDYWTFTPIGPGARRGLNRVAGRYLGAPANAQQLAAELAHIQAEVSPKFEEKYGIRLSAHDIQFGLCEFDKYERFRLGEGRPKARYSPGSR